MIFHEFEIAPRQHTRLLPAMMDQVLEASGLSKSMISHCAFTNGPGAFTGVRIAAAQAQAVGLALGVPLVPVSTLALLAQVCLDKYHCNHALVALDARMQEIYWAHYERDENDCARLRGEERLSTVGEIEIDNNIECGAGHGWLDEIRTTASFPVDYELLPDARAMLKLARSAVGRSFGVDARQVKINYLRNRVAEKAHS